MLDEIAYNLSQHEDVEIQYTHIADLELSFCTGCCRCYELGKCILEDDIEILSNQIAEVDGLIIGSPVYASNVTAQTKLLIDRGHFVIEQLLKDKATFAVVTHENGGGSTALCVLKRLFLFSGARYTINLRIKKPFNENPLKDKVIINKLHTSSKDFYNAVSSKRTPFIRRVLQSMILNIGIKPYVLDKKDRYTGVLKKWHELGI